MSSEELSDIGDTSKLITENPIYKQKKLIEALVSRDPVLSSDERELLKRKLNEPEFFTRVMHGAVGASIAYAIANFLRLGKKTQMLMSLMGFGIGNILLNEAEKDEKKKKFNVYNKEKKVYEVR